MTNYRRTHAPGSAWFFTVKLAERGSRLLVGRIDTLREAMGYVQSRPPFYIHAMVVMPDHLHTIWTLPSGDSNYSLRWPLLKTWFSHHVPHGERRGDSRKERGERGICQRRYWEHLVRDESDLATCVDYVHFNPVKHGHVTRVVEWPYSTFQRYVAKGWLPAHWGVALENPASPGDRDNPQNRRNREMSPGIYRFGQKSDGYRYAPPILRAGAATPPGKA
ncbi:MAG: transposase [Pseudoxanthomonas sp.]